MLIESCIVLEVTINTINYCECLHYHRFLEFEEFCQLSAKFLIEEDEEGMKRELKEAFRIYDKAGTKDIYISLQFHCTHTMCLFQPKS